MSRRKTSQLVNEDTDLPVSKEVDESAASETLATHAGKTEAISKIVDWLGSLSKEDALNCFDLMVKQVGHEAKQDYSAQNKSSIVMKGAVKEDILAIFGSEELSEEFKEKIQTLFETAVSANVNLRLVALEEKLEEINQEKINNLVENLVSKLDEYVTYIAESWVEKNEVAIEHALTTEITQDFISDMADLFRKHNINLPEEQADVVEEAIARGDILEEKLNEALVECAGMRKSLKHYRREELFSEACDNLTILEIEKLHNLQEDIEFDEDTYLDKLLTIKEGFLKKVSSQSSGIVDDDNFEVSLTEDTVEETKTIEDPNMASYVAAISRMASKK